MALYGLVLSGAIIQIDAAAFPVASPLVWTGDISAVLPAPQVGWTATETGGAWTFTPPVIPALTLAQQVPVLLAVGLGIVSTGTPALSGTYAADPDTVGYINSEVNSILLNNTFADGTTSIEWPDTAGTLHAMTIAQFKTVAAELGVFVSGIRKCVIGAAGAALPAASVTIA